MSFGQPMVRNIRARDRAIGLFVILAFVGVTFGITQRGIALWDKRSQMHLFTDLRNSHGIESGMRIDLAGIPIGHVQSVMVHNGHSVRLSLAVDRKYSAFLTPDSYLQIGNLLGFSRMLGTVSLEVRPGNKPGRLHDGDEINAIEPVSVDRLVADLKLQEITGRTAVLLTEATGLIQDLREQKAALAEATENLNQFSSQAVAFGSSMEVAGEHFGAGAVQLDESLNIFNRKMLSLMDEVGDLTRQGNQIAGQVESLMEALNPVVEELPVFVRAGNQTMGLADQVLETVSGHWLLGGAPSEENRLPITRMADPDLYREE